MLAYGLLRLAAVQRGRDGAAEDASADQILAGTMEPVTVGDGPYRTAPPIMAVVDTSDTGDGPAHKLGLPFPLAMPVVWFLCLRARRRDPRTPV